jgi:hypothetical protein
MDYAEKVARATRIADAADAIETLIGGVVDTHGLVGVTLTVEQAEALLARIPEASWRTAP